MSRRTFRILLAANWVLIFPLVIASMLALRQLPEGLRTGYDVYIHDPQNSLGPFKLVIGLLYVVFSFIVSVGLFFFKRWARALYLPSIFLGFALISFGRANLDVAWVYSLKGMLHILTGVTLAVVYYSPLSKEFKLPQR
jgi:hypothetical protein